MSSTWIFLCHVKQYWPRKLNLINYNYFRKHRCSSKGAAPAPNTHKCVVRSSKQLHVRPWCWGTNFHALISLAHSLKFTYKPINYFGPTQIFPKYFPHITQIFPYIITQLGPQNYTISTKSPNSFTLWAKSKKPNKTLFTKPIATQHL